ncbi:ABC transporter ATP-binding protein [Longibacter salinarum]|uniref:ABC transporter ATP-binding protein n=1 Tax=Longibacter salinarum TaxID=1850348 RepID=A0A2A8CZZ6_9BACT|nr:ABC transporter ATP-binding protein [Longibacter salinarum]PEN14214.1 ABC transporter ATP-binding protein [Longibacter salinarum]
MIEVENLYKSFGDLDVLEDVDLTIEDGETIAIIGRSGSGKSVLMKHLVGLLKPDKGRVLVDDIDIGAIPYEELREVRKHFGVLFQGGALFDSMTSFENIAFPLNYFTSQSDEEIRERVLECLELVRMPDVGPKKPSELSGGMRKRVALARAIALEPRYILYDEPTSGLDPETSNTIDELITQLSDELNVTSVVVTHDMHSVFAIADRAAFLHNCHMHWVGPVDDIHKKPDEILDRFVKANEYHVGDPLRATASQRGQV